MLATSEAGTGKLKYVLQDVQGSARAVMSDSGGSSAIIARHDYLPFGEEIPVGLGLRTTTQTYGATDTNREKYALTQRDDATGLDHTWWRKYESQAGRWTSSDPLAGSIGDPQSLNRYTYTQNDPVNFVDPSGLLWAPFIWVSCADGDCSSGLRARFISGFGEGPPDVGWGDGGDGLGGSGVDKVGPNPPCSPTGDQLEAHPVVKKALNAAWKDSNFGTPGAHEEGGFIYANSANRISVVRSPSGDASGVTDAPPASPFNDLRLIGEFHTHPFIQGQLVPGTEEDPEYYGEQNQPSDDDLEFSHARGDLPGIIISSFKGKRVTRNYSSGSGPKNACPKL